MNREDFEAAKLKGELVGDADLTLDQEIDTDEELEEETDEDLTDEELDSEDLDTEEEIDDLPVLTDKEKTAFDKRLERDMKKFEEKRIKELEEQFEQKYSKHKQAIDAIGGDPDKILEVARDNNLKQEALRLAEQNGWDENDTQWYIDQKKKDMEFQQLRVQVQINKLEKNPDYAGIGDMEKEILAKIEKTGGQLSAEDAFWVLGGSKRIEQIKLEASMREAEKRKKIPRKVITDTQTPNTAEKPLTSEEKRAMSDLGISADEVRRLMKNDSPKNINEFRNRNKK